MSVATLDRAESWGRRLAPVATALVPLLLGIVPFSIPGVPLVAPSGAAIAVFYWSVYRPDLMPLWAVFGLGLLQDVLGGTPLGLHALGFLAIQAVGFGQRRAFIGKPLSLAWAGLLVAAFGAYVAMWLLASIHAGAVLPVGRIGFQFLTTVGLFPCAAWFLVRIHRAMTV
jgi:rod shape-determining protein MreD